MKKWEYLILKLDNRDDERNQELLDSWGAMGWELVSITDSNGFAYMKHEKEEN